MEKEMNQFRFQDLEIWKMAIEIADRLFDVADELEGKRLFKFAKQLRGAALSISNNIAEVPAPGTIIDPVLLKLLTAPKARSL